ncbi:MAG: hypothetical protein ACFWTZ_01835 [Burkholderia sp.]|jgi:hypoxanthine-DNA glycosylase
MAKKISDGADVLLRGFPPLVGPKPLALILGSMPSEASLRAGRYYAFRSNRFWPMLAALFPGEGAALTDGDFSLRYAALGRLHIALWDTIGVCRRAGSLDSAIRDAVPNDVAGLLRSAPSVRAVLLNGRKSESMWKKCAEESVLALRPDIRIFSLPSTSPANAAVHFDALARRWGEAFAAAGCLKNRQ